MSGGSGLEGGPELDLGPGMGSGDDRREGSLKKQEANRQSAPEGRAPFGKSSRVASVPGQAGHGKAMPPPPSHGAHSSSEWNVVHKRQARLALGASLPHHSTPKGQPSVPPTAQGTPHTPLF